MFLIHFKSGVDVVERAKVTILTIRYYMISLYTV